MQLPATRPSTVRAWHLRLLMFLVPRDSHLVVGWGLVCARWALLMAVLVVLVAPLSAQAGPFPQPQGVSSPSWLLIDLSTGQTLASRNELQAMQPGGLTALMTTYLSFVALRDRIIRMEQVIASRPDSEVPAGPRLFLGPQGARVKDLLDGVLLLGAHDAGLALASAISGSEEAFVSLMNQTAQRLGMRQTRFINASGAFHPDTVSSTRDLAVLASTLFQDFPDALTIASQREVSFNGIRQTNPNRLLWLDRSVDGLMATDIGERSSALVTAKRPQPLGPREQIQRRLLVVVTDAESAERRVQDTQRLLNFGYQQFDLIRLYRQDEVSATIPVFKGAQPSLKTEFRQDVLVAIPRNQQGNIRSVLQYPNGLVAPIVANQPVGELRVWFGNQEIHQVALVAADSVRPAGLLGRAIDSLRLWVGSLEERFKKP
jgi:serine-type D-Ala-D-Ala carboxypeptidase (penicillin-binding protein 5/6)